MGTAMTGARRQDGLGGLSDRYWPVDECPYTGMPLEECGCLTTQPGEAEKLAAELAIAAVTRAYRSRVVTARPPAASR
jgi:hypothetical protein